MEQSPVNQPVDKITNIVPEEQAPTEGKVSKVLRPISRALGMAAFAAAALGPGKAEAMDKNTRNALINMTTGIVLHSGPNGTVVDVAATRNNHQIILQQKAQREQAEAMQRRSVEIQSAFSKPTNFDLQPSLTQLNQMGIIAVVTGNSLYLYHKDKVNAPDFLQSQFKVSSSNEIKITDLRLVPVPGAFVIQSRYIRVQGLQVTQGSEEKMIALDPNTKVIR